MKILLPDGWKAQIGYYNGIPVDAKLSLLPNKWAGMPNKTSRVKKSPRNFSKHFVIFWLCSKMQVVSQSTFTRSPHSALTNPPIWKPAQSLEKFEGT